MKKMHIQPEALGFIHVNGPRFSPFTRSRPFRTLKISAVCTSSSVSGQSDVAFVLSHFEAAQFLKLKPKQKIISNHEMVKGPFSIDLGMRSVDNILISKQGISSAFDTDDENIPTLATWEELSKMSKKGKTGAYECFRDGMNVPQKIAEISDQTRMSASLHPCVRGKAPTLILGGFGMHRFKDTDPEADTISKIKGVGHLHGHVLDICTGLGYTAIQAARLKDVLTVTTIELDTMVISIQKRNPWSQELFENEKIIRLQGDGVCVLKELDTNYYSAVIHDPPAQRVAGNLYSEKFYEEIARVIRCGGKLFHYIGDPHSHESGKLYKGVKERLKRVGFGNIEVKYDSYGVSAAANSD